jgi:hypothetical protein
MVGITAGSACFLNRSQQKDDLMKDTTISEIVKCMNPECTRVIVTRSSRGWAGLDVPSDRIHKIYNPGSLPFSVGCSCGHYTISVMADHPRTPTK